MSDHLGNVVDNCIGRIEAPVYVLCRKRDGYQILENDLLDLSVPMLVIQHGLNALPLSFRGIDRCQGVDGRNDGKMGEAAAAVKAAIHIGDAAPVVPPLIQETIE